MATQRKLPKPAGAIDWVTQERDGWRLGGWMVDPRDGFFDAIRVRWNGRDLGLASPSERDDLADSLLWIAEPQHSGFTCYVRDHDADGRLMLTGELDGAAVARLSTTFIAHQLERAPLPPRSLAARVSDLSGEAFRLSGLMAFTDVWDAIVEHKGDPRSMRILDWGCGCGRVTRYLDRAGVSELRGCDIDAEAVQWCSSNLSGSFTRCDPNPPLPYDGGEFDVILASGIFTHLGREDQRRWLPELRRILSRDGLLIASFAGDFAFRVDSSSSLGMRTKQRSRIGRAASLRERLSLRRGGIIDRDFDDHLAGVAPDGYYRLVYQTEKFVAREWTREFELVESAEHGLAGREDLVVMRPPGHQSRAGSDRHAGAPAVDPVVTKSTTESSDA